MNDNPPCPGHLVDCGSCEGSGRDPVFPLSRECKVCEGVGKLLLQPKP